MESTDGCNHCCYDDPGGWRCTEQGCTYSYSPEGGCYWVPCVADVEPDPGLQYQCSVDAEIGDDWETIHELLPCEQQNGAPSLPDGEEACYIVLSGDARSEECSDDDYALEFAFMFDGDPPEEWIARPRCKLTDFWEWMDGEAACHGPGPVVFPGPHAPPCDEQ